jgi:FkbM family methyltransferase
MAPGLPTRNAMHEIVGRMDVDFILRSGSVDLPSLDWLLGSVFMSTALAFDFSAEDLALDFGSHIGSFALPLVQRFGCRAACFEPDADSLRLSRATAVLNQLDGQVLFSGCGLGGADGTVQLYESDENWGHTTVAGGGDWNRLTGRSTVIDVLSLASALQAAGPARRRFVKVNIEGAEFEMFEQAGVDTLRGVDCFVGEIHYDLGRPDFSTCGPALQAAGFDVVLHPMGDLRALLVAHRR